MKLSEQIRKDNPYPENIFKNLSPKQWEIIREALKEKGFTLDRVSGNLMRKAWNNCVDEFEKY